MSSPPTWAAPASTSAIIVDGKPLVSGTHEAGGYHLNTPMIDIRAIGAGGGSIARVENGLLRVGPESAGAKPGPACYGRGGKLVTVTDADVVLGIISPDNFLGGRMQADAEAARRPPSGARSPSRLGLSVEQAAAGIVRVVDAHMADTLREVTIGRGYDPREFVIFAYGGAGPAHCAGFGAELGVPRIIVPATSMAHSAYGALASDIHQSSERSLLMRGGGGSRDPWDGIDAAVGGGDLRRTLDRQCLAAHREGRRRRGRKPTGRAQHRHALSPPDPRPHRALSRGPGHGGQRARRRSSASSRL